MNFCAIGAEGGARLASALVANTSLLRLNLTGNGLCGEAAAPRDAVPAIAELLRAGTPLRNLSLRDNDLGDSDGAALAAALGANTTLGILDLRQNWRLSGGTGAALEELFRARSARPTAARGARAPGQAAPLAVHHDMNGQSTKKAKRQRQGKRKQQQRDAR